MCSASTIKTREPPRNRSISTVLTAGRQLILSFLQINLLALTRALVRRTEHLNRGDNPMARFDVDDLDITLGDRFDIDMDHERHVADGIAVGCILRGGRLGHRRRGAGAWPEPRAFNDPYVGIVDRSRHVGQFDVDSLLHSRPQVAGQAGLKPVANVGYDGLVNIAPMTAPGMGPCREMGSSSAAASRLPAWS